MTMAQPYPRRVSTAIQFTSHDAPPSSENACSKRQDVAVISEITKRTRIGRPSNDSSEWNSPRPSSKDPTAGGLIPPPRMLAEWRLHSRVRGIVEAQAHRLNAPRRPLDVELHEVRGTVPDRSDLGGPAVLRPLG